jgi:uncharacterized protein (DUF1810 family)
MGDVFDLRRFVEAQDPVYEQVRRELAAGRKSTHWMWFIFPQFRGLGHSPTAVLFAIGSIAEAQAYLGHPILGKRLRECTALMNAVEGRSASEILGSPDDLKFRSCMTLFVTASSGEPVFQLALDKYFDGQPDRLTLGKL